MSLMVWTLTGSIPVPVEALLRTNSSTPLWFRYSLAWKIAHKHVGFNVRCSQALTRQIHLNLQIDLYPNSEKTVFALLPISLLIFPSLFSLGNDGCLCDWGQTDQPSSSFVDRCCLCWQGYHRLRIPDCPDWPVRIDSFKLFWHWINLFTDFFCKLTHIPFFHRVLDYFHVMTYDFHGSWEQQTGENSPLYSGPADQGSYIYFNVVSVPQYQSIKIVRCLISGKIWIPFSTTSGLCYELLEEQWCSCSETACWIPHLWTHLQAG